MGKIWVVFKREYLERVRTKWFIITTVFGPILLGAITIVPALMSARAVRGATVSRIEIIDATGNGLGEAVKARLARPGSDPTSLTVRAVAPDGVAPAESLAVIAVMKKDLTGFLVLDNETLEGRSARYLGRNASSLGETEQIERAIRQAVLRRRLEAAGLDPARIETLTQVSISLIAERITDQGRGGSATAATVLGFVVAFLLYMSLILYGQNALRSVLEEKTTRVAEVIISSVKTDYLLAGKVIGVAMVGITQQAFWMLSAVVMFKFRVEILGKFGVHNVPNFALPQVGIGTLALFLAFFLLGFLFYSSLFTAAGATVNSDQEAQQAAQPVMMLLVVSIIFVQPVLLAPTGQLAQVLSWLPFSAPIIMPLRMSVASVPPLEMTAVLVGLALSTAVAVWISARIYRIGLLMYGKRPTFREIGRWIMQA